MTDTIGISVHLRCFVRSDDEHWIAGCPALDVFSQGTDREDAKRCLREAVLLWVESCVERGTLDEALRESGFRRVSPGEPALPDSGMVAMSQIAEEGVEYGDVFPIHLTVPAYQATATSGHG